MLYYAQEDAVARVKSYQKVEEEGAHCANCRNAKVILQPHTRTGELLEKVKCAKGVWTVKANGKGGTCDYYAIWRRATSECQGYEPMGNNLNDFLASLPQCKEDMLTLRGCACSPR